MSISNILGMHVLSNAWMNTDTDPTTNAPGHAGMGAADIFGLAAGAGSDIVRVPLSLRDVVRNADGSFGLPLWQVDAVIRPILADAAARTAAGQPIKVFLEFGDVPAGMSTTDFTGIAAATRAFVDAVYTALPPALGRSIAAWEIGNEPNEIHNGLYKSNPTGFADYVAAVANALAPLEARHGPIDVVVGAVAYNDVGYMRAMFDRLGNNPNIDGFAIHPYTYSPSQAQVDGAPGSPDIRSKRPTDWTDLDGRQDNNDFQGAVYNLQQLMNDRGYQGKGLWITEVGVPSWNGFRNAGPDGRDDQARWTAEAIGTLEAWDNPDLEAAVIHSTLDYQTGAYNDRFSIFDTNPANNNDGSDGEGAFGLFERKVDAGPFTAKAAAYVFSAYQGLTLQSGLYPESTAAVLARLRVAMGTDGTDTIDLSARASGAGYTNGWIALARGGADSVAGSAFDDSLFGGDGNDTLRGNAGHDRIFGGAGADALSGDAGNDDIWGNTGDDRITAGTGSNRVDGGTGRDTLVLAGRAADYTITGDGRKLTVVGLGETTTAWNLESLHFNGDGTSRALANADVSRGNGLGGGGPPPTPGETLYQDVAATQWLTGQSANDVFVIRAPSSGYHAGRTEDGLGAVVWNGSRFDILNGFETLRFDDRDVKVDAFGRFLVEPGDAAYWPAPPPGPGEALQYDRPETQWINGVGSNDVLVYAESSSGYQSGPTLDGRGVVVWKGAKFDILTGIETLRFTDKDVKAGPGGLFDIQGSAPPPPPPPPPGEIVVLDDATATQHLSGTSAKDVFKLAGRSADYGWAKAQDGAGTVVWKGAQFDVLHGFETLRFDDRDVPLT